MNLNRVLFGDVTLLHLLTVPVILIGAVILARILSLYLRRMLKERLNAEYLGIFIKLTRYSIIILAVVAVLPLVGINLSGLLVAGGIVGIALGFASQTVVSNMLSGILLMIERPVKLGVAADIGGMIGTVTDIRILSTTLCTFDGVYVRLPNEKVFTSSISNFGNNAARRFEYTVGIRYSDDAEKAVGIIRNVVDAHPMALVNPAPQIFVDALGDNSVNIIVRIWAPVTEWFGAKMALLWKIKTALEAEGMEIPFPQRTLWFEKQKVVNEE